MLADLLQFIRASRVKSGPQIVLKKDAAGFAQELFSRGFWVTEAEEDDDAVISGIRAVANGFARKSLRIHESCTNLLREFELYRWERTRRRGSNSRKQNSFSCDALRRVAAEIFQPWRMALEE